MIYQSSHQAPTMSSTRKSSPRPQRRGAQSSGKSSTSSSSSASSARSKRSEKPAEKCRGRCRVQWSEKHVKEGLVLVQEAQLARVVKTGPISEYYEIDAKPFASGQWARVYRCKSRSSGIVYAAKYSSRSRFNADCSAELRHEIALLSLCSQSPRVVRLHDVYETPKEIILVMEFAPGGDLQTLIDGDLVPLEGDVVHFVRQLVEGLAYLHERNIAHLDIKPQNLVMMGTFPECDVKLCDFEISRVILEGTEVREILGTPDYVAPEILHYEPITLAADMWSLGVTTYVLLTGFSPFGGETDQETFRNISLGEVDFPEELFEDVSTQAKDFVAKLLVPDPRGRMTAKQCLRHDWLRGAPTQASPHLRRYLSKSREVLLERVVSRENLRRAALLSQASSQVSLSSEVDPSRWLNSNLSQSEVCLSQGLSLSRSSLPSSEEGVSPADSRTSLDSPGTNFALSQSCLLNKEQTQGLLSKAQSRSQANLDHGSSRRLLSRMRNLNQSQSQACLLNGNDGVSARSLKRAMDPLFSRSREKLYGLRSLSKSQGVLGIYRSLECLRNRKNSGQVARTEDMLPIFSQLSVEIANSSGSSASSASMVSLVQGIPSPGSNQLSGTPPAANPPMIDRLEELAGVEGSKLDSGDSSEFQGSQGIPSVEVVVPGEEGVSAGVEIVVSGNGGVSKEGPTAKIQRKASSSYESEENLNSLQSIESDTLTEDSDEPAPGEKSLLGILQPSQRQHSDVSSHSNNSGNSDEKEEHSESEHEEPKYTVAQLVSAFNRHQEVASKSSLEAIMTEKRINEVNFPTGPKALRLFIPDIDITGSSIVRRRTSYKPRKNWEELRKRNERNEGVLKDLDRDSGNEEDEDPLEKNQDKEVGTKDDTLKTDSRLRDGLAGGPNQERDVVEVGPAQFRTDLEDSERTRFCPEVQDRVEVSSGHFGGILEEMENAKVKFSEEVDPKIDLKYKQCVDGVKSGEQDPDEHLEERSSRTRPTGGSRYVGERVANYIFPEIAAKEERVSSRSGQERKKVVLGTSRSRNDSPPGSDSTVNLKDILQSADSFEASSKENLENLRKRTSIAKIIVNDNLACDSDSNNNGTSPPGCRPANGQKDEESCRLYVPPSFVRSSSLSSESSCPTPSSARSEIGTSWEDVQGTKGSCTSLEREENRCSKRTPGQDSRKTASSPEERRTWGKVCTGSYTRAMERFSGRGADASRKSPNLPQFPREPEKTRRKSSPAMPHLVDS